MSRFLNFQVNIFNILENLLNWDLDLLLFFEYLRKEIKNTLGIDVYYRVDKKIGNILY